MNARNPEHGNCRTNMVDSVGTTAWRYDAMGRLVGESGPFGTPEVQVAYDPNGRLTNVTWGAFSVDYSFDDLGRIVAVAAPEGTYAFTYLSNGIRRATVAYPNGVTETRAHDALARCTSLVFLSGTNPLLSIAYAYDAGDRRTNEVWSTGRAMAYGYDDAHQLTSVAATRPSDAARYRYDAAGNPVDRAEFGLDVTNSFNNLNQIVTGSWTGATLTVAGSVNYPAGSISVNGQPGTVYPDASFDVAGVPVAPGTNTLTATYTGPAFTNVPMTATDTSTVVLGDTAYTHDANGNLTGDATFLYQYDLANQLTNVVRKADNTRVLSCRYDALGRRVEAIRADGTTDRYVYFPGSFLVLAVLDENNAPKEFYTRGPDLSGSLASAGGIGGILACTYSNAPSAPLYHHADLMGNIIALTDTSSTLVSSFRYTPLGQLIVHFGSILSRHLFSSKEFEKAVFLYCYGLRTYSPTLARWLTRDPIGERGGMNVYQYCNNNAVEYIDWIGLSESLSTMPIIRDDASQAAPGELYWNPDMPGNEGTTADSLSSLLSNMNSSHIRLSGPALEAVKSESRIYVISSLMDQLDCCHGEEGPASIPIHYDDWPQYGATSLLEVIGDFVENQQTATSWTVGSGHLRCSGNASITRVPCPTSDPCACETRGVVKLKCNLQDEFDYQYDPSRGGVYNFGAILISQVIKRSVFVNTNWEDKFLIRRKFNCGRKQ